MSIDDFDFIVWSLKTHPQDWCDTDHNRWLRHRGTGICVFRKGSLIKSSFHSHEAIHVSFWQRRRLRSAIAKGVQFNRQRQKRELVEKRFQEIKAIITHLQGFYEKK